MSHLPPSALRVREHTDIEVQHEIDRKIVESVRFYSTQPRWVVDRRIVDLDKEWDVERVLETNASSLALGGLALGILGDRKWLFLTGGVLAFLLQHATQGWCPPLAVLRRKGIRTRYEIDLEKNALKALRGDFDGEARLHDDGGALTDSEAISLIAAAA